MIRYAGFFLIPVFIVLQLSAQNEKRAGIVDRIQNGEIHVRYSSGGKPLQLGDAVYITLPDGSVELKVTYPMQTYAKCSLGKTDAAKIIWIKKGQIVYTERMERKAVADTPFVDNGDGTITDSRSGLMWLKDANIAGKPMTWGSADEYCVQLNTCGYTDWRLPTNDEFDGMIKGSKRGDDARKMFSGYGAANVQEWYWTGTSLTMFEAANAWSMNLTNSRALPIVKLYSRSVWPVRSTTAQ